MTASAAIYRLTLSPGDEAAARRFYEVLNDDLEGRDALGDTSISYYEDEPEGWIVEVIGAEVPGLAAIREAAHRAFGDPAGFPPFSVAPVPDTDWVTRSQQGLPPVRAGAFVVYGSHDRERVHARRLGIKIDAGEAFGTAHHGTTRGCLVALDWLTRRRRFGNVLDLGAGTGVLAIAAAKRGIPHILATDIDDTAVRVARENVAMNGVAHAVTCLQADGLHLRAIRACAPYDFVLANILAEPLMAMADDLRWMMTPGGAVVLSGLLSGQAWRVAMRYVAAGFVLRRRIDLEGWASLVMIRRRHLPAHYGVSRTLLP
ncbi:MAG: 50S ribosomal protein L11 methyltransferase [Dichotomicrobium sp.]